MAQTQSSNIRTLLGGGAGGDRLAATHFLVGAAFLVLGGAFSLLSLLSLRFAGLFPLTYGRFEPMANLSLIIGFAVISLVGGVYYVLPRLTGTVLWRDEIAGLGLLGTAGIVVLGLAATALGLGSGRGPFDLPWWLSVPLALVLAIPAVVTLGTVANREEQRSYVSIWFVLGGTAWLFLLTLAYLVGDLPFVGSLAVAYADVFYSAGLVTLVVFTLGTGLFYYTVVKELDVALASRQLAMLGFWSLGFAAVWWGVAQVMFGPGPTWVSGVVAALGLAFPIGALANAANVALTLEGSWGRLEAKPGVTAGVYGLFLGVGVAFLAAMGGFRSIAAVTSLTAFWEAIEYAAVLGAGALLVAGISFQALPRLLGREIHSLDRARSFARLTVIGAVGVLVFMAASGVVSGYSWIAGSNSAAYIDAGEGWQAGAGEVPDALLLIAILFAFVTFAGQLAYASTVFGTVTRGKATTQELLVTGMTDDE